MNGLDYLGGPFDQIFYLFDKIPTCLIPDGLRARLNSLQKRNKESFWFLLCYRWARYRSSVDAETLIRVLDALDWGQWDQEVASFKIEQVRELTSKILKREADKIVSRERETGKEDSPARRDLLNRHYPLHLAELTTAPSSLHLLTEAREAKVS